MKSSTTLVAAVFAGCAILSGCASNNQPQQIGYMNQDAASYGTIDSIQIVQAKQSSGAGAVRAAWSAHCWVTRSVRAAAAPPPLSPVQ
jgi:outer membrane murein-binding lipoprotein Lpp